MKTAYNVDEIRELVQGIIADIDGTKNIDDIDFFHKPDKAEVREIIDNLFRIVYPGYFRDRSFKIYNPEHGFAVILEDVFYHLNKQVAQALDFCRLRGVMTGEERAREAYRITREFMRRLPAIRRLAETDLLAAYDGDPAAGCLEEIILAYPGLMASTVYRLAHELYLLRVPVLPRLMTEYAHAETGIDIHPGAVIGRSFFIDHGTGIVIGETAIIGQNVKIYQGVTIGDNVTIYAGASILGGETVIGANSIIGGNTFITSSVPADTRVTVKNPEMEYRSQDSRRRKEEVKPGDEWCYVI